jgi:acyl carrier protein
VIETLEMVAKPGTAERQETQMETTDEVSRLIAVITEEVMEVTSAKTAPHLSPDDEIAGLGLDSVDTMELLARLEDRESADIPEAALSRLRTIADVIDLIRQYRDR